MRGSVLETKRLHLINRAIRREDMRSILVGVSANNIECTEANRPRSTEHHDTLHQA